MTWNDSFHRHPEYVGDYSEEHGGYQDGLLGDKGINKFGEISKRESYWFKVIDLG